MCTCARIRHLHTFTIVLVMILPNMGEIPLSGGGDMNPFEITSGRSFQVKMCQIRYMELPTVVTLCQSASCQKYLFLLFLSRGTGAFNLMLLGWSYYFALTTHTHTIRDANLQQFTHKANTAGSATKRVIFLRHTEWIKLCYNNTLSLYKHRLEYSSKLQSQGREGYLLQETTLYMPLKLLVKQILNKYIEKHVLNTATVNQG